MHEVFNFSRFRRLFVKHTAEHYRTYLMSIGVLAGVLLLGGAFIFYVIPYPPDAGFQTAIFVILLMLAGTLFTSTVFADFGDKNKAVPAMTLPATTLEKFLVGWLYSYPIFILVYIGVFYLALYGLGSFRHWERNQHFHPFDLRQPGMDLAFVMYSMFHAFALFGAIYFKKLHFIKSAFVFFITAGVALALNTLLLKIMTGLTTVQAAIPFGFFNFKVNDRDYAIAASDLETNTAIAVAVLFWALLIWIAAYFRLKEKQV